MNGANDAAERLEDTCDPLRAPQAATRRDFLRSALAAAGAAATAAAGVAGATATTEAALLAGEAPTPAPGEKGGEGLVDANVNLGRWPLRRLPCDDPERLVAKLRSRGVVQAWAGSLDGLLHKDLGAVNARLADVCRKQGGGLLLPFGSLNPRLPDWEEELRRAVEVHGFRGIRLHPNYHGYRLDDPMVSRLLGLAAERRLIVQIALVMEDERMMHPLLRVEPVDPAPLTALARKTPELRLVLINALRTLRGEPLRTLVSSGNVWVEISMLEGVGGLGSLLGQVPAERILFGSHAPLFYFEAAELKLRESALAPEQHRAIVRGNAEGLLG